MQVRIIALSGNELACIDIDPTMTTSDLLDKLVEAHEYRICVLVYQGLELYGSGPGKLSDVDFSPGDAYFTAIFRTREWFEERDFTPLRLMSTDSASKVFRSAHNLKSSGYTVKELFATGYSAPELQTCLEALKGDKYTVTELKNIGFSVKQMLEAGYQAPHLRNAGFSFGMFQKADLSTAELISAGFSAVDFLDNGYTLQQLQKLSFTAGQMKCLQSWPSELKEAGYTAGQLKVAGYGLAQIRQAFSLEELKEAGYSAWVLAKSGFGLKELLTIGFSHKELGDAGFIVENAAPTTLSALPSKAA